MISYLPSQKQLISNKAYICCFLLIKTLTSKWAEIFQNKDKSY